jgi:hypothetical protein
MPRAPNIEVIIIGQIRDSIITSRLETGVGNLENRRRRKETEKLHEMFGKIIICVACIAANGGCVRQLERT